MVCAFFFFFKQKTAYEMRISDWSSDVCSSDLPRPALMSMSWRGNLYRWDGRAGSRPVLGMFLGGAGLADYILYCRHKIYPLGLSNGLSQDRKSCVSGKKVSLRGDFGGRRSIKTTQTLISITPNN